MNNSNNSVSVKHANGLFMAHDYEGALNAYLEITKLTPQFNSMLALNIEMAKKGLARKEAADDVGENLGKQYKIAVVLHIYHLDVVSEILERLFLIPCSFDLYITSPFSNTDPAIKSLLERFPDCIYKQTANRGRDILPFLKVLPDLMDYDVCLKLHTKRGLTNYGDLWREKSLSALMNTPAGIQKIINLMGSNQDVSLAGPEIFYSDGRRMMYGNYENIKEVTKAIGIEYDESRDWGFFAGTMFWFQPKIFESLSKAYLSFQFEKETGRLDGGIEHALERIFGLIPSYLKRSVVLMSDGFDLGCEPSRVIEMPGSPSSLDPTSRLAAFAKALASEQKLMGDINKQSAGALADMRVRGWLAIRGDNSPREYAVRIGSQEFLGLANQYRGDLDDHKINSGCHAFELLVPLKFADGKEYKVSLFDSKTGIPIAQGSYRWNAIIRPYSDFNSYLAWSYTNQYVNVPFVEADKRAFAVMEELANDLVHFSEMNSVEVLISIVMPVYNREKVVSKAINSVLAQKYISWELIIVDDGSSDGIDSIIDGYSDSRIKYHKLGRNFGVSKARNFGLSKCSGAYVAYLDTDNTWDDRYLSVVMGYAAKSNYSAKALYTGQLVYEGANQELHGVRFGMYNKSLLLNSNFIDLNCFVHAKEIDGVVISFRERLRRYVDWEFISRISNWVDIVSLPVLLSNYFLRLEGNSITGNANLLKYKDDVDEHISDIRRERVSILAKSMRSDAFPVSVVVPSYNVPSDLVDCLDSLVPYIKRDGFEVIIVDNNSSEETVGIIKEYCGRYPGVIKAEFLNYNYGFTYAVNAGIRLTASTNDVLLLNNDAVVMPGALERLRDSLHSSADYGICAPAQILPANTETITAHVPYAAPDVEVDVNISSHHNNLKTGVPFYSGGVLEVDFVPFFCVLIRRDLLGKKGALDFLNGRHYRSDRTYCAYIKSILGLQVVYDPSALVYHKLQKGTAHLKSKGQKDDEYKYVFLENAWPEKVLETLGLDLPLWNRKF